MIAISEKTYHKLAKLGDLEDSFDTVISKLIRGEKTALTRGSLAGSTESTGEPHPLKEQRVNDRYRSSR